MKNKAQDLYDYKSPMLGQHRGNSLGAMRPLQQGEDRIQVRMRGKNNFVSMRTGSVNKTNAQMDDERSHKK